MIRFKFKKIDKHSTKEELGENALTKWLFRYITIPLLLFFWLHYFEAFTYAWDPDFMGFCMLLSTSFGLYLLLSDFFNEGPKWQHVIMKVILGFLAIFIFLGFSFDFIERDDPYISLKEAEFIEDKLELNPSHEFPNFKRLESKKNNFIVLGKKTKRIYSFSFAGSKKRELTFEEQFDEYITTLLPKDFKAYRNLINSFTNNTSRQILYDYYGWKYPNYKPLIYVHSLQCENFDYPSQSDKETSNCFFWLGEGLDRSLPHRIRPISVNQDFATRFKMYYKVIKNVFFPTFVREDLKNDPYFLIEDEKYEEARRGLDALPPKRRAFCEAKLKALVK